MIVFRPKRVELTLNSRNELDLVLVLRSDHPDSTVMSQENFLFILASDFILIASSERAQRFYVIK